MAKNFRQLEAKMSPERLARSEERAQKLLGEMALDELRVARQLTQVGIANILGVNQASVSKMERQTDMYISTLSSYLEAMGARLVIEAVFPGGKVRLNQFEDLSLKSPTRKPSRAAKKTAARLVRVAR